MDAHTSRSAFWTRMLCVVLAGLGLFLVAVFSGATAEGASPACPPGAFQVAEETLQAKLPMLPGPMTLFLLCNGALAGLVVRKLRVGEH